MTVLTSSPLKRIPSTRPPFTLGELKRAVPPHCFQRSLPRSMYYVATDVGAILLSTYLATFIPLLPPFLQVIAWPLHWTVAGSFMLGAWLIGHDCGHHAFSDYKWLNDVIGFVLHSAMLTPYFSWKYSHTSHHANTGSTERQVVFLVKKKDALPWHARYTDNPPLRVLNLTISLFIGWPLYLTFNVSGRTYDSFANHFYPQGPNFTRRQRAKVLLSDLGVTSVAYAIYRLTLSTSLPWMLCIYGLPLLFANAWIVAISYLNHIHPALPLYDEGEWDWMRGTMSTVNRDFGWWNYFSHHITDGHVAHHLVPTMPHYHVMEATEAIKPILGEYYLLDRTPVWRALYRETKECLFVAPEKVRKGVHWFGSLVEEKAE
nr:delta12 fatty acid desaturase [Bemisia tabaci]